MIQRPKQAVDPITLGDGPLYNAHGEIRLPKDRFFDPWHRAISQRLQAVIQEAYGMVQAYEDHFGLRQRKRKVSDQKILEETVEAILCDMMVVHLSGETRGSAVPLSHSVLGTRSRYRPAAFTKQLPNILKALASSELDFIRMQVGWQKNFGDRGQRTLIWPGWRILKRIEEHNISLADIGRRPFREVIVLKAPKQDHWDESQYLDYEDTPSIVAMRQQMIEINEWLEQADIDVPDAALPQPGHQGGNDRVALAEPRS